MNAGEFAFFNQQLAALLRNGVPLEGALARLSADMRRGKLRTELRLLEADLQNGRPLAEALQARKLPEFYRQMIRVGAQSNDLPAVLLLLADYYQNADANWTRLQGLMVYPLMVLMAAFALSGFLAWLMTHLGSWIVNDVFDNSMEFPPGVFVPIWMPPIAIGVMLVLFVLFLSVPGLKRRLHWRLPVFKDAKLARVASAMCLLLKRGGNLGDALDLLAQMEKDTRGGRELAEWRDRLAAGHGTFAELAAPGKAFPPLFCWLVASAGEDLAGGFQRASEIYRSRAAYRTEWFLNAVLPFSIIVLGTMIILQLYPGATLISGMFGGGLIDIVN